MGTIQGGRSLGWAEVLGEVVNETGFIIGRVKVTITLKNASGKVLDFDYTYVSGKDVEIDGYSNDSGIFPGETAPFRDAFSATDLDSVDTIEYTVTYDVAGPRTDLSDTPVLLRISRIDSASQANQKQIQRLNARMDSLSSSSENRSSGLIGDLDDDGDVDFADFLTFASNFGKTV